MLDLRKPKQRTRYLRIVERRRDTLFPQSERIVRSSFKRLAKPVVDAYRAGGETSALKEIDSKNSNDIMRNMVVQIWQTAGGVGYDFSKEMWGVSSKDAKKGTETNPFILTKIEEQFTVKAVSPWMVYVANYMNTLTGDKIKWLRLATETKNELQRAIFSGVEQEESIPEITDRIEGLFTDMPEWRATRIARSETIEAFNQATLQQSKDSGSKLDRLWVNTDDDRTRPAHKDYPEGIGGTTIPYDADSFLEVDPRPENDDGTEWPGDAVNCRCSLGFAVPEKD